MNDDVQKFTDFYSSSLGKEVLELEAKHLRHELKGCQKILDVGCGTGVFEQYLSDLDITGLDNDEEMLAEARERNPERRFVKADIEHLVTGEISGGSFDGVFALTTLEYLSNHREALMNMWRLTKPKGRLVAMILNPYSAYFHEHFTKEGSYFMKIKNKGKTPRLEYLEQIGEDISDYWNIYNQNFVIGIKGEKAFPVHKKDKKQASIYAITAKRKEMPFSPSI